MSLHLLTVIILYGITEIIKFDVGFVIERGFIESTQGRCTRALIHPSLITRLRRMGDVPMSGSQEKSPHKLPVPLLKQKDGSSQDSNEESKEEREAATEEEESNEEETTHPRLHKLITDLASSTLKELIEYKKRNHALHMENAKLTARQEVLTPRQQMQVDG